jgi:hypothetical protein
MAATEKNALPSREQDAIDIIRALRDAGHVALLAGGCVRDKLLGRASKDFDVATDAPPDRVRALFRNTQSVGAAFGVILVHYNQSVIEVATFRADGTYSDGRRPDSVQFSTAEHDAQRRDFTINGLFFDPLDNRLIDYVNGERDLHARVLRAIGDPAKRFAEDYLRLLRAVRFAARFDLAIEPLTRAALLEHAPKLTRVTPERVGDELRAMLSPATRVRAVELLTELGFTPILFRPMRVAPTSTAFSRAANKQGQPLIPVTTEQPGQSHQQRGTVPVLATPSIKQGKPLIPVTTEQPGQDHQQPGTVPVFSQDHQQPGTAPVFSTQSSATSAASNLFANVAPGQPMSFALALSTYALDVFLRAGRELVDILAPKSIQQLVHTCRQTMRLSNNESASLAGILSLWPLLETNLPSVATLKRFLARETSDESRLLLRALRDRPDLTSRIDWLQTQFAPLDQTDVAPPPLLTGDHLVTAGFSPGPRFKLVLDTVYDEQLELRISTPEQALAIARKMLAKQPPP